MSNILRYYGYAEIALYFLIALLCALRARSAGGAYGACFGIFVLWTVPAMYFDAYLGRDVPGIGYLVIAPFYAVASPLMHFVIRRISPRVSPPPVLPSHPSAFIRLCRLLGNAAGRERCRQAIDKEVRLDFQQELAATAEHWARAAVEEKIADEVERRMKEVASPRSLWRTS